MARQIDANHLFDRVYQAYGGTMDESEANLFMRWINEEPTLTPPNEALTCEGCYYIKNDDYSPCAWCIRSKENEDYYRRPPEGEA